MSKNKKPLKTDPDLRDSAKYVWRENIMKILTCDPNMINHFKANTLDTMQSFALIFIALPTYLLGIYLQYDQSIYAKAAISFQLFSLVLSLGFLVHNSIYYLILARIAESFDRWESYLKYIQIRNLLLTVLILAGLVLVISVKLFSLSDSLNWTISLLLGIYGIFIQYFIIRKSFESSVGFTIGLILLDNVLEILFTVGILSLIFPIAAGS